VRTVEEDWPAGWYGCQLSAAHMVLRILFTHSSPNLITTSLRLTQHFVERDFPFPGTHKALSRRSPRTPWSQQYTVDQGRDDIAFMHPHFSRLDAIVQIDQTLFEHIAISLDLTLIENPKGWEGPYTMSTWKHIWFAHVLSLAGSSATTKKIPNLTSNYSSYAGRT
jgi:hypothetical protein